MFSFDAKAIIGHIKRKSKHPPSKLGGIAGKGGNEATPLCDSSPQQAAGYSRWNFIKGRQESLQ